VVVNLTNGGEFQGRWQDVKPFGLNVITEDGEEKFLSAEYIWNWQHDEAYPNEPIFKFRMSHPEIWYTNVSIGSEVLLAYYYLKDTLDYYTDYREILYGSDKYTLVINDSQGIEIPKYEVIASIDDNKITFNDNVRNYLAIGEAFTIEYEFKTRGGLVESKHVFIEVQPYEMKFYNSYNILSGGSIIAPLYYNMSSNYRYQLALNYRLMEKGIHTYQVIVNSTSQEQINIEYNEVLMDGPEPIIFAYYYNDAEEKVWIDETEHITYNSQTRIIIIKTAYYLTDIDLEDRLHKGDIIYVELASNLHNKYRHYHDFDINLRTDDIILLDWTATNDPENTLIANYESPHFIYDVQEGSDWAKGKVKQIYATLDESTSLRYYLDEDLADPNGWADYKTLIMKLGLLNPYVLDHLEVKFYFTNASGPQLIGMSELTLDIFDDDTGAVYIPLPESDDFDKFTMSNNAYIEFTPVFYEADDFEGYFYEQGLPTMQTVIWDAESVEKGMLNVNLEREAFSTSEKMYVLNNIAIMIIKKPMT
jgi:hypothetical protein